MGAENRQLHPIRIKNARANNLQGIDLELPVNRLIVITGVSGSGKSSLAFDTLYKEGARRYLETFSAFSRQHLARLEAPPVDSIEGLPPVIAVSQLGYGGSGRSTVGTMSGIHDLLRLLYARAGTLHCRSCGRQHVPPFPGACATCGATLPVVGRSLFSFNTARGACPECNGLGTEDAVDPGLLVADPHKTLRQGALVPTLKRGYIVYSQVTPDVLDEVCRAHGFSIDQPWGTLTPEQQEVIFYGSTRLRVPFGKHPLESRLKWTGLTAKPREEGYYKGLIPVIEETLKRNRNENVLRFVVTRECRACHGGRLGPEALSVTVSGLDLASLVRLSLSATQKQLSQTSIPESLAPVAGPILAQLEQRLSLLDSLGLGYLALRRPSATLAPGERQRIRLASQALGGLRNVLYVLDEPSVGLHPSETHRLLKLLFRLRDAGNTVVVVEHDPLVIAAADHVVELGPGAGPDGGRIVYAGPPKPHQRPADNLPGRVSKPTGELTVHPPAVNNLQIESVTFKTGALNALSGPSGSGKSTLISACFSGAAPTCNITSHPRGPSLAHPPGGLPLRAPPGSDHVQPCPSPPTCDRVVVVDNTPIGRTPRSNAATYTGLWDQVRKLYAGLPQARRAGFKPTRFSFNTKGGRCEACHGAGVRNIGLFFLGQVPVVCDQCRGRRFDEQTLAVRFQGHTVADLLAMTVDQALPVLAGVPKAKAILDALHDVGLGYVPLGQPSTTLSGGEAQRIKLAGQLASPGRKAALYLLSEPTTGLHPSDIERLLAVLHRIAGQGHTVIAIENDLQFINACDRVVDLGPGSGELGGRLVFQGHPAALAHCSASLTGAALSAAPDCPVPALQKEPPERSPIQLREVATHNLRSIDVDIPMNRITVVTGPSGSGKSSLAFDTLYAEGQRRFAQGLSAYARQYLQRLPRPAIGAAVGLTPPIAVHQNSISGNPRSTLATVTDMAGHLRLLWSRCGDRPGLTAAHFSFNSQEGACPDCGGFGQLATADPEKLITHPELSLFDGAMRGHKTGRFYADRENRFVHILKAAGDALGHDFSLPWEQLGTEARQVAMYGTGQQTFEATWNFQRKGRRGSHTWTSQWPGLVSYVNQEYERKHADKRGEAMLSLLSETACGACNGERLVSQAAGTRLAGLRLPELLAWPICRALSFFAQDQAPRGVLQAVWEQVTTTLHLRLSALDRLGLGYLTLDRRTTTLSGGEARRVRLATQLGARLCGVTCILDEPTAGLHPRDTDNLLEVLRQLRDEGNTVVVVEHDAQVIREADWVIELGPGGGTEGGRVEHCGPPRMSKQPVLPLSPQPETRGHIDITGATAHNLQSPDVRFLQGALNVITGVSGSGKSTLLLHVLKPSMRTGRPVCCGSAQSAPPIKTVRTIDASPIGRTPASTPATFLGILDVLRKRFAATPDAVSAGLTPSHFSYVHAKGRCPACKGSGHQQVAMDFMADVWVPCEECLGKRYRPEVLRITLNGLSVADILNLSASQAACMFAKDERLNRSFAILTDLGLDYLPLGQPATTLSGGEAQRLKLASQLVGPAGPGSTLFLLDEPTRGLADSDVQRLLTVLHRLAAAGHTIVAVEHNLLFIASCARIIDLGPEGGERGGQLMFQGTPAQALQRPDLATGAALADLGRTQT